MDEDQDDVVLVLPSGERINLGNVLPLILQVTDDNSLRLIFQQTGGSPRAVVFAVGEGGILLATVSAGGPMITARVRTGDADYHARREHIDLVRKGATEINLTRAEWSRGNPDDIRSCREMLLSALEVDRTLKTVKVGHRFLANLEEKDQRRVFRVILDRPSLSTFGVLGSPESPKMIHTSALLETMVESHNRLQNLILNDVRLKDQFEVEQLASALRACGGGLQKLTMLGIVSNTAEHPSGFLDPLLEAILSCQSCHHRSHFFSLRGYARDGVLPSGKRSLLTPTALRSLFKAYSHTIIHLHSLGLDDEHCKAIAEVFAPMNVQEYQRRALHYLSVRGNGAIGDEGYEALLGVFNRNHGIDKIKVDDSSWQETFDLVFHMNVKYGRRKFMEDGVFAGKDGWVDWLAKLTNLPSTEDEEEEMLRANALWFTLRNEPSFIYD
jgi:hypothetical protein